jgi:hypothetical protein
MDETEIAAMLRDEKLRLARPEEMPPRQPPAADDGRARRGRGGRRGRRKRSAADIGMPLNEIRANLGAHPLRIVRAREDDRIVVMAVSLEHGGGDLGPRPVIISRRLRKIVGGAI